MSVKLEKVDKNTVKLEITVDAKIFEAGMEKSYRKNIGKYNIPGFRKGKAPRKMIENYYGEGVFYEDAINIVCSEEYDKALIDNNIEAVSSPEVDIIQIGSGKDLIFTAVVATKPEVKLGQYKDLEVEKHEIVINEEDVEKEIQSMRDKNSRIITIDDRPVQSNDIAVINFEGFIDGIPFDGGKGENYELTIGSNQFIAGFEDQLIGVKLGEEVDVKVKFPDDYHNKDVASKDALFKVKVNEIKVKELPPLDNDFAKDVSEFDTIEDLKNSIKEKLAHEDEHKQEHEIENTLIKLCADNAEMDIPEAMIVKQIENMEKDFNMRLRYQGLDLNKYLQLTGTSIEDFRSSIRPQAIEQIRQRLTLETIAKEENISFTEEEYGQELEKLASTYRHTVEEFRKHLHDDDIKYIKDGIIMNKTIDFIVENSKIVEDSKKESKKKDSKKANGEK